MVGRLVASRGTAVRDVEVLTSFAADVCGKLEFANAVFISMAVPLVMLSFPAGIPLGTFAGSATDLIPAFGVEFATSPVFPILAVVSGFVSDTAAGVAGVLTKTIAASIPGILSGKNAGLSAGRDKWFGEFETAVEFPAG